MPSLTIAVSAGDRSANDATRYAFTLSPRDGADCSASASCASWPPRPGVVDSSPIRETFGAALFKTAKRFAVTPGGSSSMPVTLPPGWSRLCAKPLLIMPGHVAMTMGMAGLALRISSA